jgi:hypothetical protein
LIWRTETRSSRATSRTFASTLKCKSLQDQPCQLVSPRFVPVRFCINCFLVFCHTFCVPKSSWKLWKRMKYQTGHVLHLGILFVYLYL